MNAGTSGQGAQTWRRPRIRFSNASRRSQPRTAARSPTAASLSDIVVSDGKVFFSISVDAAAVKAWEPVRKQVEEAVKCGAGRALRRWSRLPPNARAAPGRAARAGAGRRRPAAACRTASRGDRPACRASRPSSRSPPAKGGVGKSTTAINLALGLRDLGLKVGVLDADIYGPSMPKLLAIREKPETIGGTRLKPIERYGLKVMSIGFLIEEETPMIWRGPMVMSALTQMLREVEWGDLDIMVVDMPPGTGDAQLTMAQQVPLAGAVIVSTPQDLALIDARRGIAMFKRVNVPILGVIENMSYFVCPQCGTRSDIFGHGGARHEAERLNVPFLGEVPLDMTIRETSDSGLPVVATQPDGPHAKVYRAIAATGPRLARGTGRRPRRAEDRDRGVTRR